MTFKRILAIGFIFLCTAAAWFILGGALTARSHQANANLTMEALENWGPSLCQQHPVVSYASPTCAGGRKEIAPTASRIRTDIEYAPAKRGLVQFRTYDTDFKGTYTVTNPLPIRQTLYFRFRLPAEQLNGFDRFSLSIDGANRNRHPEGGVVTEALDLDAGASAEIQVSYHGKGTDRFLYRFDEMPRVLDFELEMTTNFPDYDIPSGCRSASAKSPHPETGGLKFLWSFGEGLGAAGIGMDMPNVLNPGPVAARMTFFAPVSLLFFFAVLLIVSAVKNVSLHPMHFFFLAAGCFAFQLLFAYLVDLIPAKFAFAVSAGVSLLLIGCYLRAVAGWGFARLALLAQFAYMTLFSYSFFIDGLTGITITLGAVVTLAILMAFTAKTDWSAIFRRQPKPNKPATPPPTPA